MLGGACANVKSLTARPNGLTISPINGRIPGRLTGLLEAVLETALVYKDIFLDNGHMNGVLERDRLAKKNSHWAVHVPG